MNSYHDDNDDNNHSRSDPGRGQRQHSSCRKYSASVSGSAAIKSSKFTFNTHEYGYGEGRYRVATGGSDTHSLIQRAARSALLDDVTPTGSTILSADDVSDDEDDCPNALGTMLIGKTLPNIRSLEKPSLPAIPDEQDRKRFVGCLAAVLSSMYDYESYELQFDKNTCSQNENENEVSGFFDFYESSDEESTNGSSPPRTGNDNDQTKERIEARNNTLGTKASTLSSTPSTDTAEDFFSRTCKSFESIGSSTLTTMTGTTTTSSSMNKSNNRNISKNSIPPLSKSKLKASFRRQAANLQRMNSNDNSNMADQKSKLSRQRYLSRRYELYSGLLLSSSELLLLDKSIARAFLPMLSRVLIPQIHKTQNDATDISDGSNNTRTKQEEKQQSLSSVPKAENEGKKGDESFIKTFHSPDVHLLDNIDELSPFLDSLTPGSGFRCVSLLLLQHLLTSENGYDSRIRQVLKKLCVLVLRRDRDDNPVEGEFSRDKNTSRRKERQSDRESLNGYDRRSVGKEGDEDYREYERRRLLQATRKFEALEQNIARRLILLSTPARNRKSQSNNNDGTARNKNPNDNVFVTREQLVRGVKIGGAGILAGALFAVTGGLAAPGIAAGVAAVAGAVAGTAAVSALTSAAVVTTIFGVGGGGLAAYKMQRRTQGVTEFEFCRESNGRPDRRGSRDPESCVANDDKIEAELFSILCISGWLRDQCDYQRPWGLQPTHPRISNLLERLERFYSVHSPDHVPKCERILNSWKGEERKLWEILRQKYGRDPDHLFPLNDIDQKNKAKGAFVNGQGVLTLDQEEILDKLFIELGYHSIAPEQKSAMPHYDENPMSPFEKMRNGWKNRHNCRESNSKRDMADKKCDSMYGPSLDQKSSPNPSVTSDEMQYFNESQGISAELLLQQKDEGSDSRPGYELPKHLSTVWDWKTTYGGELYTVKWESRLLMQICDCVTDLAVDVVTGATRQILKQTVLHTLLAAVILPSYLLNLMDTIDGDWTIAVERADEAGVVLAKTLLYSRAGRRPVTLVGYSFGARIIYSCLKELARYQEEWEQYRELLEKTDVSVNHHEDNRLTKYRKKMKGMREPASIVEDAVLMGLPNHLSLSSWKACRQVVAGRLVNCYSNNDLILSLMFQAKRFSGGSLNHGLGSILKPVCGTCRVEEPGVENIDCSDLILGHQDYCLETGKILERIGLGEPIRLLGETRVNGGITIS